MSQLCRYRNDPDFPCLSHQCKFHTTKVDINSHEMKELFLVFSLLTIILTASAVNGQPFNTETNNTGTESQSRTFTDCYASFYSGMILLQVSEKREIDSELEI